jgi:phosphatidylglycerol:prolipoprotein diacylglycerol transferase
MFPYFDIGPVRFEPYGFLVVLGTTLGILWLWKKRESLRAPDETPAMFWGLVYAVVIGGLIGGKLGYILVEWSWFRSDPWLVLLDWRSGWVFWFAVLGSIAAGRVYQLRHNRNREKKRAYLPIADYIVTALPMGHWIGRLGCFSQGCCHGSPTSLPWAVSFSHPACNVPDELLGVPLHPTQLYESAAELALAAFLYLVVIRGIEDGRYRYGTAFFSFLGLYGLMRFSMEFLRGDDRGAMLSGILSPSQWISLAVVAAAAWAFAKRGIRENDPAGRSIYL